MSGEVKRTKCKAVKTHEEIIGNKGKTQEVKKVIWVPKKKSRGGV